jgi:hypothetical protein
MSSSNFLFTDPMVSLLKPPPEMTIAEGKCSHLLVAAGTGKESSGMRKSSGREMHSAI